MDGIPINIADLGVIAVVVISGLFALYRGVVHELLSLGAWFGAGVATFYGIDYVLPIASQLAGPEYQGLAGVGAGTALFLAVLIVLTILTRMLVKRIRRSGLGALDRSIGLLFGLARGALLVAIAWLVAAWAFQDQDYPDWVVEAKTLPLVQEAATMLYDALPKGLRPDKPPPGLEAGTNGGGASFETLREIAPKAAGPEEPSGYKEQERDDLQGLVEENQ
jgi:membrane protein required for colicin V production